MKRYLVTFRYHADDPADEHHVALTAESPVAAIARARRSCPPMHDWVFVEALPVLGDALLVEGWFDAKALALLDGARARREKTRNGRRRWRKHCARPTRDLAQATAAALLFGGWSDVPWPCWVPSVNPSRLLFMTPPGIYTEEEAIALFGQGSALVSAIRRLEVQREEWRRRNGRDGGR